MMHVCSECSLEGMELKRTSSPLDAVGAGLQDASGQQLPLQAVHVKCKLMDLLAQVPETTNGTADV